MTLTQDLKQKAIEVGFVSVGVTSPNMLQGLPHGWVGKITNLRLPQEELSTVKSLILMCFRAWDRAFDLSIDSPNWRGYGMHAQDEELESYFFVSEIMRNKGWLIVDYLKKRGFDALVSSRISLKTAAVRCGLGWQGKNALLITPRFGPRVRLISVLTTAELEIDEPYKENLCGNCEKCLVACPTRALEPYRLKLNRCMTYSAESPHSLDVPADVRQLEKKLIQRPTSNSYIECSVCVDVCPIGTTQSHRKL